MIYRVIKFILFSSDTKFGGGGISVSGRYLVKYTKYVMFSGTITN